MFFSISKQRQDNFSLHWQVDNIYIDTDAGWKTHEYDSKLLIYKGYVDQNKLDQCVETIKESGVVLGNFCLIEIDRNQRSIRIISDLYRSYPIYFTNQVEINNLVPLTQTAWTDSCLEADFELDIVEKKIDVVGEIGTSELDYETALQLVDNILLDKVQTFVDNNDLPLKVYLSGGIDTLLVYSYLVKINAQFELLDYNHIDHDYFWRCNSDKITKYWGYKQIHHWRQPCVLASGAPGDEFMLRSPVTANLYLNRYGTSIPALIEQNPQCLHYDYFNLDKHKKLFQEQLANPADPKEMSDWGLCNIVANDWQHWHLGNTLTWTPLRDIEIFKILLRLPKQHAIEQILDSKFSKDLIERNATGATQYTSDQKNTGPLLKNLNRLFQ